MPTVFPWFTPHPTPYSAFPTNIPFYPSLVPILKLQLLFPNQTTQRTLYEFPNAYLWNPPLSPDFNTHPPSIHTILPFGLFSKTPESREIKTEEHTNYISRLMVTKSRVMSVDWSSWILGIQGSSRRYRRTTDSFFANVLCSRGIHSDDPLWIRVEVDWSTQSQPDAPIEPPDLASISYTIAEEPKTDAIAQSRPQTNESEISNLWQETYEKLYTQAQNPFRDLRQLSTKASALIIRTPNY